MPRINIDTRPPSSRQRRARKSNSARRIQRNWRRRRVKRKKPLALQQHAFVERAENQQQLVINTEVNATGVFESFALSKMKQQADYCKLFEFYRIDKIVATFRYKGGNAISQSQNAVAQAWGVNEVNPLLYFKVDHNDNTADTLATMKDSMKTRTHMFTNSSPEFSIQLKPATQKMIYESTVTTAYAPQWGQWIPTIDPTVPHYALKMYAIAYADANNKPGTIAVSFKYYVSFKNNE